MHPGLVDRGLKLNRYRPISTCRILDTRRALHASHAERMGHGQKIMKTTECGRSRENKNTILFKKSFFEKYYPRLMHFNYYDFSLQVVGFNPCCFYLHIFPLPSNIITCSFERIFNSDIYLTVVTSNSIIY